MASKIDTLLASYEMVINEPWTGTLSSSERTMFLVFDPSEIRKVEMRLGDFELATKKAGKRWELISLKQCFPTWMSQHKYRDEYFVDPESIVDQLETKFRQYAIDYLNTQIDLLTTDENTLIAIKDVASIYGFSRLTDVINSVSKTFKGRLLVLFPGEYDKNHYRLLDARDGWNYIARPITA
jgi:hypothetical protein